jgi:hypothetical protein
VFVGENSHGLSQAAPRLIRDWLRATTGPRLYLGPFSEMTQRSIDGSDVEVEVDLTKQIQRLKETSAQLPTLVLLDFTVRQDDDVLRDGALQQAVEREAVSVVVVGSVRPVLYAPWMKPIATRAAIVNLDHSGDAQSSVFTVVSPSVARRIGPNAPIGRAVLTWQATQRIVQLPLEGGGPG